MKLNQNQEQAVMCSLNPTLVIAGPGSGKTQVLVSRIHYMIQTLNCMPNQILVVTFSKLAAEEMKERFTQLFGASQVTFGTLHSIFYRILRQAEPAHYALEHLIQEDKRLKLLRQLLKELDDSEGEEFLTQFTKHLSLMKNQLIAPAEYNPTEISRPLFLNLLRQYEIYKEQEGLFDFDDMLVECYYLLKNNPTLCHAIGERYQYVLVDEFQDINLVQFEILKLIVAHHQHLFVVGDDDQSIYRFRGAKPEYLLNFKNYFNNTQTFYLNINYRCSGAILKDSLLLINQNQCRYPKQLTTPNTYGEKLKLITCDDQRAEALHIINEIFNKRKAKIPFKEMAIIYRTNIQVRTIVETLLDANIPFYLRDGLFSLYDQWITKDILSYLYLAQGINEEENAYRILNKPKRYINKVTMNKARNLSNTYLENLLELNLLDWQKRYIRELITHLAVLKHKPLSEAISYIRYTINYTKYLEDYAQYRQIPIQSLLDILDDILDSAKNYQTVEEWESALINMDQQMKTNTKFHQSDVVTLTTMHGAKGLEFSTVFILDVVDKTIPHFKSTSSEEIEEERRLLYVSMTRAKQHLFMYIPKQKYGKLMRPSPFIQIFSTMNIKEQAKQKEEALALLDSKLKIGQQFSHKKLGLGHIIKVLENHMILAKFSNNEKKKLDSQYCISNDIIKWEDDNHENK